MISLRFRTRLVSQGPCVKLVYKYIYAYLPCTHFTIPTHLLSTCQQIGLENIRSMQYGMRSSIDFFIYQMKRYSPWSQTLTSTYFLNSNSIVKAETAFHHRYAFA